MTARDYDARIALLLHTMRERAKRAKDNAMLMDIDALDTIVQRRIAVGHDERLADEAYAKAVEEKFKR